MTALRYRLRRSLERAAKRFNHALNQFDPTTGEKTYPERMVSYYFVRAVGEALQGANVLLEMPVTIGGRQDNHIDALIYSEQEVVLAEFKRGWAPSHWKSLATDYERLQRVSLTKEIQSKFRIRCPRRAYIFLGTDCWVEWIGEIWKTGESSRGWTLPKMLHETTRDYVRVYKCEPDDKGKGYDGYYFAWALAPYDRTFA